MSLIVNYSELETENMSTHTVNTALNLTLYKHGCAFNRTMYTYLHLHTQAHTNRTMEWFDVLKKQHRMFYTYSDTSSNGGSYTSGTGYSSTRYWLSNKIAT